MKEIINVFKLDHFGRGIGHYNGKVLFIDDALDNERVEAEIIDDNKKIINGQAVKIIKTNPERKTPECPFYKNCGGCNIMHMNYPKQLNFKLNKVEEILSKFANVDKSVISKIIPTNEFNYRNKVTLKVKEKVGFYKKKTYELIYIDECMLALPEINKIIEKLNSLKLEGIEEIIIRSTLKNETMIIIKAISNIDYNYYEINLKEFTNNLIIIKDGICNVIFGKGYITEKIGEYYYKIAPLSFFQVNTNGAEKLYNIIKEYAQLTGVENILDLYCGTGTIGIYLSKQAKKVTGIEINHNAVECALDNVKVNGLNNVDFICKDVSKSIDDYQNIDLIVVDPPRAGLKRKAVDNILKIKPNKIIYVSCNPSTLARDLNTLKNEYSVESITLIDMFPNTYHVECVCLLSFR